MYTRFAKRISSPDNFAPQSMRRPHPPLRSEFFFLNWLDKYIKFFTMPRKRIPNSIKAVVILIFIAFVVYLISPLGEDKTTPITEEAIVSKVDTTATIFAYNNILFSMPSPYHISILLEKSKIPYNKDLLNSAQKATDYIDNFHKSINFGIYGADLGYINIYKQTQDAANYFAVLKILSQDIGLYSALDKPTINRIERNIENRDSLLVIISNTYRRIDNYLKDNERQNTGSMILAGGWIEGIYLLTQQIQQYSNKELIQHIAQQKRPLENLIKLLVPYSNESKDYYWLVDRLIDLAYTYDQVEEKYTYLPPQTHMNKKFTLVRSKLEYRINDQQIKVIAQKVQKIRNQIVK